MEMTGLGCLRSIGKASRSCMLLGKIKRSTWSHTKNIRLACPCATGKKAHDKHLATRLGVVPAALPPPPQPHEPPCLCAIKKRRLSTSNKAGLSLFSPLPPYSGPACPCAMETKDAQQTSAKGVISLHISFIRPCTCAFNKHNANDQSRGKRFLVLPRSPPSLLPPFPLSRYQGFSLLFLLLLMARRRRRR